MSFLEQVTSVLMEDIRMEEDGNCNLSTAKKGTRGIPIAGSPSPQYALILSDVNSVLRSSMVTAQSASYSRVCCWKLSRPS